MHFKHRIELSYYAKKREQTNSNQSFIYICCCMTVLDHRNIQRCPLAKCFVISHFRIVEFERWFVVLLFFTSNSIKFSTFSLFKISYGEHTVYLIWKENDSCNWNNILVNHLNLIEFVREHKMNIGEQFCHFDSFGKIAITINRIVKQEHICARLCASEFLVWICLSK